MNIRKTIMWSGFAVLVMSGVAQSPISDKVIVNFTNPVVVAGNRLPPGEYTIRQLSSANNPRMLEFSTDNGTNFQARAAAAPALRNNSAPETVVELEQRAGEWHLKRIWLEGESYGYQFPVTEREGQIEASARRMTLRADYRPGAGAQTTTTAETRTTTTETQTETAAAAQQRAEQERLAQERAAQERAEQDRLAQERTQREQAERDRAEQERLAQERAAQEREAQERAAQERAAQTPASTPAAQDRTAQDQTAQDRPTRTGGTPEMPETAGNWATFLIAGLGMATLAGIARLRG